MLLNADAVSAYLPESSLPVPPSLQGLLALSTTIAVRSVASQAWLPETHQWCSDDKAVELGIKQLTFDTWQWIVASHRIYCLTPHPDSLLMWAHYGDRHKGMCLGFDAQLHFGRAYRVRYADSLPVIGPDIATDGKALIGPLFCTKSSEWCYEDEYRLVLTIGATSPPALSLEGNYLILPPGALRAIVAGYDADVAAIRALVQEHAPGVLVKRAIRRFHEYHLDIVDDILDQTNRTGML